MDIQNVVKSSEVDSRSHNRDAWNKKVREGNRWTAPVDREAVERARQGRFELLLTPTKPVPPYWFPALQGTPTLCLASGGGQQGPLLAAAGAVVTVFDNSPRQLEQDQHVARRDGLAIETAEGDMADLSAFADETFGLIVHPCSNCFVPAVRPVWRGVFACSSQRACCWPVLPTRFATSSTTNGCRTAGLRCGTRFPTPT